MCMMFDIHDTAKFEIQSWCCESLADKGSLQSSGSRPDVEENIALRRAMRRRAALSVAGLGYMAMTAMRML